jgi:hypothetical protein
MTATTPTNDENSLCYTFSSYLLGRRSAYGWCPEARKEFDLDVLRHPELLPEIG